MEHSLHLVEHASNFVWYGTHFTSTGTYSTVLTVYGYYYRSETIYAAFDPTFPIIPEP
jgi:hypothetical protein